MFVCAGRRASVKGLIIECLLNEKERTMKLNVWDLL